MKIKPEFFNEKGLNYLVIEENSLWKSLLGRVTGSTRSITSYIRGVDLIIVWINDWKLLIESLKHILVLDLEGTHYILATKDEIHDACN